MKREPPERTRALAAVMLAALTLAAFAPVLNLGFVDYDDDVYVLANPHIQHGLDTRSLTWAMTSFYASNWHPLTWISHMIDWSAYGAAPSGHHVTSALVHLAAALVLFLALSRMTGAPGRSALAAALFAVHPLHVESVAWLAERKDVLCALFWFLAVAGHARWIESPRPWLRASVMVCAALALLSKPMAVTLPITLLLVELWPLGTLRRHTIAASVHEKIPLLVMSAASAVMAVLAQHTGQAMGSIEAYPFGQRLSNAAFSAVDYLVKTFWPVPLSAFYPHPDGSLPAWKIAGSVGALIVISTVAVRTRRTRPYLAFGWIWYLVTLLPVIGIVQVGEQGMADRYTYVPLVGIFVAAVWGAYDALSPLRLPRKVIVAAALVLVALLTVQTRRQLSFWKDGTTLFGHALAVTDDNDVAHAHLGLLLAREGWPDEAAAHFREAIRIHPGKARAHLDYGTNLIQQGKWDEALAELREALRLDPRDPLIHTNLGGLDELRGDLAGARASFENAARIDPDLSSAHLGLGSVLESQGQLDDAVAQFRIALQIEPTNAEAHDRIGTALAQLGRADEAFAHFAEALRLDPKRAETQRNWGTALASASRYREASSHFAEAIRLDPKDARAHFSLAAASFFLEDYAGAWREVRLSERYGLRPPEEFLRMLSARMQEPR